MLAYRRGREPASLTASSTTATALTGFGVIRMYVPLPSCLSGGLDELSILQAVVRAVLRLVFGELSAKTDVGDIGVLLDRGQEGVRGVLAGTVRVVGAKASDERPEPLFLLGAGTVSTDGDPGFLRLGSGEVDDV